MLKEFIGFVFIMLYIFIIVFYFDYNFFVWIKIRWFKIYYKDYKEIEEVSFFGFF